MSTKTLRDAVLGAGSGGRGRGKSKSRRANNRRTETKLYRNKGKLDELPRSAGMNPSYEHGAMNRHSSYRRQNFGPITRLLHKNVNKGWRRVHSRLCAEFGGSTLQDGRALATALTSLVRMDAFEVREGKKGFLWVFRIRGYGDLEMFKDRDDFYVDPGGILRLPKRTYRARRKEKLNDVTFMRPDKGRHGECWTRTSGVWRVYVVHRVAGHQQEWYQNYHGQANPAWGNYDTRLRRHFSTRRFGIAPVPDDHWTYWGAMYTPTAQGIAEALKAIVKRDALLK